MKPWSLISALVLMLWPVNGHGQALSELSPTWGTVLAEAVRWNDSGERVVHISARFVGTPYRSNTLIGSADTPEQLVVSLDAVDCFTLLDYVEALRRSNAPAEFRQHLAEVRYHGGRVAWESRRHFFTDWADGGDGPLQDVTGIIGGSHLRQARKELNRKADGSLYLPGVAVRTRAIGFIPSPALDRRLLERLQSGDYLGVYAPAPGLDVSHVGIVVRQDGRLLLRHASSHRAERRVIDSDLAAYLADKPGIVVLRPQPATGQ
jgi:hypothetical protein